MADAPLRSTVFGTHDLDARGRWGRHRGEHRGSTRCPKRCRRSGEASPDLGPVRARRSRAPARSAGSPAHLHPPMDPEHDGPRHGGDPAQRSVCTSSTPSGGVPRPLAVRSAALPSHQRPEHHPAVHVVRADLPDRQHLHLRDRHLLAVPSLLAASDSGHGRIHSVVLLQPQLHTLLLHRRATDAGPAGRPRDPGRGVGPRPPDDQGIRSPASGVQPVRVGCAPGPRHWRQQGTPAGPHLVAIRSCAQHPAGGRAGRWGIRGLGRQAHHWRSGRLCDPGADAHLAGRRSWLDHRQPAGVDDRRGPHLRGPGQRGHDRRPARRHHAAQRRGAGRDPIRERPLRVPGPAARRSRP